MEILRFDDAESTSARRKKSSRGMIVVGLIATLFGVGTAFASTTISINGGAATNIGQGVSAVSACDDDITIGINNSLNIDDEGRTSVEDDGSGKKPGRPKFTSSGIVLSKIDSRPFDTSTATGCGGEVIELQIFRLVSKGSEVNQAYTCGQLGITGSSRLRNSSGSDSPSSFGCTSSSRTISFIVPQTDEMESSWTVPINPAPGLSPLDISYFTIVSRSAPL